ncbi:MAG: SDR family NAD(P)-dependent oxidoreductase [Acidimicrobiales bacterium]|nr:SDR family NAD(P)-dependent oxidoreductase [Acidimicrobiales bacterium]
MDNLSGKTAVITGGASGIGRAFADRFAAAGMNIVIGDIEGPALEAALAELEATGASATGVVCDVSSEADMHALRWHAIDTHGAVHLVCLNAGVGGGNGRTETLTERDWAWTINVNVWGIIHGLTTFVGDLKAQDDGHVVITASVAGLTSYPSMGPYNMTKHAAVAMAETLFAELRDDGSNVGVSCLCPGLVLTNIFQSDRNRPEQLTNPALEQIPRSAEDEARLGAMIEIVASQAKQPSHVAELVHDAVVARQFWINTDEDFTPAIHARLDSIRDRTDPPAGENLLSIYD